MVLKNSQGEFLTDDDLQVANLGRWPEISITNPELLEMFKNEYGREFIGGDEIVSFRQALVARGMDFYGLQEEILEKAVKEKKPLKEIVFNKTATGIGRGHSMGGLTGVVISLHGSKMIDSGLTGLVASRSLVTSGRRRDVKVDDIVVPENIANSKYFEEYLQISRDAFKESKDFKAKFGRLEGIESFNKALPYNNPADLFIVLPLDTMATLAFETMHDAQNPNGPFLPKELYTLVDMFPKITEENGLGTMYKQRINVPRDGYFHYNVFKDPSSPNYALELAQMRGFSTNAQLISSHVEMTKGFAKGLKDLKKKFREARKIKDSAMLPKAAMDCMLSTRALVGEYNEALSAKLLDTLSFRVWSEQKRHSTLRQSVEPIYSAAERAANGIKKFWPQIQATYERKSEKNLPINELEKIMVIDDKLKKSPELLVPYVYHSARQLMFYDKMVSEGVAVRDAAYMIPRNTRTMNVENYDLVNLIDLEMPLRLCKECEPERYQTSWQKRNLIAKEIPQIKDLMQPKCSVGYCTEGNYCGHITGMRRDYNKDLHANAKEAMLRNSK